MKLGSSPKVFHPPILFGTLLGGSSPFTKWLASPPICKAFSKAVWKGSYTTLGDNDPITMGLFAT